MAHLKLLDLRCIKSQEGGDEPYLKVNGQKVWKAPYEMKDGSMASLRSVALIPFEGSVTVELWEEDTVSDDHMGTTQIGVNMAGYGELDYTFNKGAMYVLIYEVWR